MKPLLEKLKNRSVSASIALTILCGVAYLPLLDRYGFGAWTTFITSPFSFQISRIALYSVWFVAGFVFGSFGLEHSLLARGGQLARYWRVWVLIGVTAYNALWFIPRLSITHIEGALWVISNVASCMGLIALFRGTVWKRRAWMDSLSRSAYVMYLVHYPYVTWAQRLLMGFPIHAGIKFALVFLETLALSWLTAQLVIRIPGVKSLV
jgi:hypothetical protein